MTLNDIEKLFFWTTRLFTLVAVLASLAGALIMFYLGADNTYAAFEHQFHSSPGKPVDGLPADEATVISLMVALDNFLIGVVLLFFSYGVYGLFIRPEFNSRDLGLPEWMHVEQIGQLKQTIAEVILVVLFVLFLRIALQSFQSGAAELSLARIGGFLMLPFSILMLAGALKLVELHPKPRRGNPPKTSGRITPAQDDANDAAE